MNNKKGNEARYYLIVTDGDYKYRKLESRDYEHYKTQRKSIESKEGFKYWLKQDCHKGVIWWEGDEVFFKPSLEKIPEPESSYGRRLPQILMPMIRQTFPELTSSDIVGVQPMSGIVGDKFALAFSISNTVGAKEVFRPFDG